MAARASSSHISCTALLPPRCVGVVVAAQVLLAATWLVPASSFAAAQQQQQLAIPALLLLPGLLSWPAEALLGPTRIAQQVRPTAGALLLLPAAVCICQVAQHRQLQPASPCVVFAAGGRLW